MLLVFVHAYYILHCNALSQMMPSDQIRLDQCNTETWEKWWPAQHNNGVCEFVWRVVKWCSIRPKKVARVWLFTGCQCEQCNLASVNSAQLSTMMQTRECATSRIAAGWVSWRLAPATTVQPLLYPVVLLLPYSTTTTLYVLSDTRSSHLLFLFFSPFYYRPYVIPIFEAYIKFRVMI